MAQDGRAAMTDQAASVYWVWSKSCSDMERDVDVGLLERRSA